MRRDQFEHCFVDSMPGELEEGVLYVCIRYRTSAHLCACGCGNRVTTPIRPPKWHLKYDGKNIGLTPSVGSWQFPCRSHYWIKNDQVRWSAPWTDEQIEAGRERDQDDMRLYYEEREVAPLEATTERRTSLASLVLNRIRRTRRR